MSDTKRIKTNSGVNFGNNDIIRQISFYLNQSDKIEMAKTSSDVNDVVKNLLPTSTEYVTTIKPNLISIFKEHNGVYSSPIDTFKPTEYGFGDFYVSMFDHISDNEDKNYYCKWRMWQVNKSSSKNRFHKNKNIDLFISELPEEDDILLSERLMESIDTSIIDHNMLPFTDRFMESLIENTSIVHAISYDEVYSHRCGFFSCIAERQTDVTSITIEGDFCEESAEIIAEGCVDGLKTLIIESMSDDYIDGFCVNTILESISEVGIIEKLVLEGIRHLNGDGLPDIIMYCENLKFLSLKDIGMCPLFCLITRNVIGNSNIGEIRIENCDRNIKNLDLLLKEICSNDHVKILGLSGNRKSVKRIIPELVNMIIRGNIQKLDISYCSIGKIGIKKIIDATKEPSSKLTHIDISGNILGKTTFRSILNTSLTFIHIGDIEYDTDSLSKFVRSRRNNGFECIIDDREGDIYYNERPCQKELFELVYSGEHWEPI